MSLRVCVVVSCSPHTSSLHHVTYLAVHLPGAEDGVPNIFPNAEDSMANLIRNNFIYTNNDSQRRLLVLVQNALVLYSVSTLFGGLETPSPFFLTVAHNKKHLPTSATSCKYP